MIADDFAAAVTDWYAEHARDLPWRATDASPWGVLVSEVMLQQTPVVRVLPVWRQWLARWPAPSMLAAEPAGESVRAWGRLGYPRRALRLHAAACAIVERHAGSVPSSYDALLALPGVGSYTAAAVASFGFGARLPVLDTNVRRVFARVFGGTADVMSTSPAKDERAAAAERVPADRPARFNVAVMELGALVCTARTPKCFTCPLVDRCRWRAAGYPEAATARRPQPFAGTDRQVRGRLMAVLREADESVPAATLVTIWNDAAQRQRCLASLLADGLVEVDGADHYRLPA